MPTSLRFTLELQLTAAVLLATAALTRAGEPGAAPADVRVEAGKDRIDFRAGKGLAGSYFFGPDLAKPYFWPLNSPAGEPFTRPWPMERAPRGEKTDHVHQKSAWFCHGDVIPEGLSLNSKVRG